MDQQAVLGRGIEVIVYGLRIQRAEPYLVDFYVSQGMPADDVPAHIEERANMLRLRLLAVSLAIAFLGYALSKFLPHRFASKAGAIAMYAGLVLCTLQIKRHGDASTGPMVSILSVFKKK